MEPRLRERRWPGSGPAMPEHEAPLQDPQTHIMILERPCRGCQQVRESGRLETPGVVLIPWARRACIRIVLIRRRTRLGPALCDVPREERVS